MKIIDLRVTVVGAPWRELVFLELTTDTGLTGVSEVRMVNKTDTLVACIGELAPRYVVGADPFDVERLEGEVHKERRGAAPSFSAVIMQIMLLDIVFSLDSVITAVGMAEDLAIMVAAVVLAVAIMMFSAEPIAKFVNRHPTIKVLALSFLLLIGVSLIGDGLGMHVPKGYIYFAMGFSVFVEMINLRVRGKSMPVKLHSPEP